MSERPAVTEARGLGLVAFSAACFGAIPIAASVAQAHGLPLTATLAWRYAVGALLLVALAGTRRRAIFTRAGLLPLVVLGAMQALVAGISLSALRFIPAATLSFLFYTYPAWIAIIAAVRRTEALTTTRIIALALSLAGITVMVGAPGPGAIHPAGVALALVSALLYALYVPIVQQFERRDGNAATATYAATGAALAFVAAGLLAPALTGGLALPGSGAAWVAVLFLAVFSTAIGFLTFLRGLAAIGPVRAGIVSTVEPFVTALLAALVLGQRLTLSTVAGGACVAAAVILLQRAPRPRRAAASFN